jgi:hypothetical protein
MIGPFNKPELNKKLFQKGLLMNMVVVLSLFGFFPLIIIGTNHAYAFVATSSSSTGSINGRGIVFVKSYTDPIKPMAHNTFTINSTILNNSSKKIQIALIGCNGPLSARFDNHIDIVKTGFCNIMRFKIYDLNPGQSMMVSTKDNLLEEYTARFSGMTNATLQLLYNQNGTLLSHTQPFVFTIYPCIQSSQPCP